MSFVSRAISPFKSVSPSHGSPTHSPKPGVQSKREVKSSSRAATPITVGASQSTTTIQKTAVKAIPIPHPVSWNEKVKREGNPKHGNSPNTLNELNGVEVMSNDPMDAVNLRRDDYNDNSDDDELVGMEKNRAKRRVEDFSVFPQFFSVLETSHELASGAHIVLQPEPQKIVQPSPPDSVVQPVLNATPNPNASLLKPKAHLKRTSSKVIVAVQHVVQPKPILGLKRVTKSANLPGLAALQLYRRGDSTTISTASSVNDEQGVAFSFKSITPLAGLSADERKRAGDEVASIFS